MKVRWHYGFVERTERLDREARLARQSRVLFGVLLLFFAVPSWYAGWRWSHGDWGVLMPHKTATERSAGHVVLALASAAMIMAVAASASRRNRRIWIAFAAIAAVGTVGTLVAAVYGGHAYVSICSCDGG